MELAAVSIRWIITGLFFLLPVMMVATPARAGSSTMLELLKVLRDNGTLDASSYAALRAAASKEAGSCSPPVAQSSPSPAGASSVPTVSDSSKQNKEKLASFKQGPLQVDVGGRIQFDTAKYGSESGVDFGSGAEMRRARLEVDGKAGEDWTFRTTVEFAGGADLKTAYFKYLGWKDNELIFGKHRESILLDELTSSKYTTFMERAMITEFHPGRNPGFGWRYIGGQLYGQAGVFFTDIDEAEDDQLGLTGRLVWRPVQAKRSLLHFGIAASTRDTPPEGELRFRARPESHVTDVRLIDTDTLTGIDRHDMLGLEAVWVNGPLSVQAEYLQNWLRRDSMPSLQFGGWYAYASWFITGEARAYRGKRAAFGRVKPKRPLGSGGLGAWELAARFSRLDLTDQEIVGGREDNFTFGVNWYPTANTRFTFNFVKVLKVDRPGDANDGVQPSILQVRAQLHF